MLNGGQYDPNTATSDLGIPLRMTSDINGRISRSTVEQTYQRILGDLQIAAAYLPEQSDYTTRPSRPAAYAMLAKTHLQMGEYSVAKLYADSCLSIYSTLLDYNEMELNSNFPFSQSNAEVIFHSTLVSTPTMNQVTLHVDTNLLALYDSTDLRLNAFFRNNGGVLTFKGSYNGSSLLFSGLTTAEVFLIRAECYPRLNENQLALRGINSLLWYRYDITTYEPFYACDNA